MTNKQQHVQNSIFIPQVKKLLEAGHTVRFRARGWSMRIFIEHERDDVLLKACCPDALRLYDVVLAEVEPQYYVLHRIVKIEGDSLVLKGDGNIKQKERCCKSDVIGVAFGFYRKGHKIPDFTSSLKWRIYSYIWLKLSPFRRCFLGVYRHIWLRFLKPL